MKHQDMSLASGFVGREYLEGKGTSFVHFVSLFVSEEGGMWAVGVGTVIKKRRNIPFNNIIC